MAANIWKTQPHCYRAELELDLPPEASQTIYRNSDNMVLPFHGPHFIRVSALEADVSSQNVIVIGNAQQGYLLAGAVTCFRSMTFFKIRKHGGHYRYIEVEQPDIKPDETPEEIVVLRGADYRELLVEYAEITARKMGVKPIQADRNLTGYCTWYYYYADVTEQDFLENLDACAAAQNSSFAPQVVQIDDGYQALQGDWLIPDANWQTPLVDIAQKIARSGMTPGIWLMPFLASTASQVYQQHPDWFVKRPDGSTQILHGWSPEPDHLWCCLDMTQKPVQEHIKSVFRAFWDMGFRYFKLDALAFGLMEGVRADPSATPISAYRLCFKAIREAVPEAFLLACTPPFLASLGYVDSCRVSPDTSRYWRAPNSWCNSDPLPGQTGIANALHATLGAWWMYDRFFRCDPDTLMARQDNAFYTLGEARISVLTGILTGVAITSDHLGTISPHRQELLARAARYRLRDARPLNWRPSQWPQLFEGTVDGVRAVAVINDGNVAQDYVLRDLDLGDCALEVLQPQGEIHQKLHLESHDAALLLKK